MKSRLKQALRQLLGPALNWLSAQLEQLQQGVDALSDGQDTILRGQRELVESQRAVSSQHDIEIEVVGRTLSQQREALESLGTEQRRLADEVRELRLALGTRRAPEADADPIGAPQP